jgi:hypothetical protein
MDNNSFDKKFEYLNNNEKDNYEKDNYENLNYNIDKLNEKKKNEEYYKLVPKNSNLFYEEENNIKIYDLSLSAIVKNFTKFIIEMLDDLVDYINNFYVLKNKNKNMFNEFITIFIKKDRLIYSGIFFILLSFIFYFMDISS